MSIVICLKSISICPICLLYENPFMRKNLWDIYEKTCLYEPTNHANRPYYDYESYYDPRPERKRHYILSIHIIINPNHIYIYVCPYILWKLWKLLLENERERKYLYVIMLWKRVKRVYIIYICYRNLIRKKESPYIICLFMRVCCYINDKRKRNERNQTIYMSRFTISRYLFLKVLCPYFVI